MPDDLPTAPAHRELAVKVVSAYLRRNQIAADQVGTLIGTVHRALAGLGKPASEAVVERTPAVPIRRSVHRDFVVCLDCGWKGQMLRRHLTMAHGLTGEKYRVRWSLPADHPIVAPAYSERRSGLAKELGLGRRGGASAEIAMVPEVVAEMPPQPSAKQRGRRRSAATPT
jgi:predicted transcriptional regulator